MELMQLPVKSVSLGHEKDSIEKHKGFCTGYNGFCRRQRFWASGFCDAALQKVSDRPTREIAAGR